jgi:protein-L-isoaspartate(D-aspartate) O-methyltransferase
MPASAVERARAAYAEKIRGLAGLRSPALFRALGRVPREDFVGPGPWKIALVSQVLEGYRDTPDADPCHLYDNVLVALDPARRLNNGEPAALLRWFDSPDRAGNVSCTSAGVGYYTAIARGGAARRRRSDGPSSPMAPTRRRDLGFEVRTGDGSQLAGDSRRHLRERRRDRAASAQLDLQVGGPSCCHRPLQRRARRCCSSRNDAATPPSSRVWPGLPSARTESG